MGMTKKLSIPIRMSDVRIEASEELLLLAEALPQVTVASLVGVSAPMISQWVSGKVRMPVSRVRRCRMVLAGLVMQLKDRQETGAVFSEDVLSFLERGHQCLQQEFTYSGPTNLKSVIADQLGDLASQGKT